MIFSHLIIITISFHLNLLNKTDNTEHSINKALWNQRIKRADTIVLGIATSVTDNGAACWDLQIVKSIHHCNWVGIKDTNQVELFTSTSNTCVIPFNAIRYNGYWIRVYIHMRYPLF